MNDTLGEAEACSVGVCPAGCPAACFSGSSDRQAILAMNFDGRGRVACVALGRPIGRAIEEEDRRHRFLACCAQQRRQLLEGAAGRGS